VPLEAPSPLKLPPHRGEGGLGGGVGERLIALNNDLCFRVDNGQLERKGPAMWKHIDSTFLSYPAIYPILTYQ